MISARSILQYPQPEFSWAIRTIKAAILFISPGRPTLLASKVHLSAINRRCHHSIVSGVTIVATRLSVFRPRCLPFAASRRCRSLVSPTTFHLLLQDPVLLDQVRDDVLLVAVHPTSEGPE